MELILRVLALLKQGNSADWRRITYFLGSAFLVITVVILSLSLGLISLVILEAIFI